MSALTLDAQALYTDLLHSLRAPLRAPVQLVGVTSGGVWLAERLARDLGRSAPVGVISSALHRDDYARRGLASAAQTRIPFAVDDAHILLLDDVLHTGRTVRAVINELFDFGRPARVQLAVLVDRGGRELPIAADYCAARISLPAQQTLALKRADDGSLSFHLETR